MNRKTNNRRRLLPICAGALAAAMIAPPAWAGSLGRLFFTPEQRAQSEQARARKMSGDAVNAAPKETASPKEPESAGEEESAPSVLTVNGIVQKRGGARTVWVNGVAQNADSSGERAPESLAVTVPGKIRPVRVKVGQQLLLENPVQPKPAERKPPEQKPAKAGDGED